MSDALHVVLAERLCHLDRSAWTAMTHGADVFLRAPFLEAMEAAGPANVEPRYVLLYRGTDPVAALALQLVHVQGRQAVTTPGPLGGMAQWVDERALVLGSLSGWGQTGLALAPGVDAAEVWPEVLRVLDGVRRFEKSDGAVTMAVVKDAAAALPERTLRRAGYQRAPTGADMRVELAPGCHSLEDYLARMTSKARAAVRKTVRDISSAGYEVRALSADELARHEARLDALYGQVWSNAEVRPVRLSGRFFVTLQRALGDGCAVVGLLREGALHGFGVCLKNRETSVGYYLGYERAADAPLYLRLLVAMLEQGLAWGVREVSLGRTSEEPKARLGAVPVPSWLWVKHRTPPLNWAVGTVLGAVRPAPVAQHRVFKAAAGA